MCNFFTLKEINLKKECFQFSGYINLFFETSETDGNELLSSNLTKDPTTDVRRYVPLDPCNLFDNALYCERLSDIGVMDTRC